MCRFEEDYDPDLTMSYATRKPPASPANLDILQKELAKAVVDGAKRL
jgi:hypothetical protein